MYAYKVDSSYDQWSGYFYGIIDLILMLVPKLVELNGSLCIFGHWL